MTVEQQEKFREEFKSIVYKKGLITENATYIKNLCVWDKNDSHKAAILQATEQRVKLKEDYHQMLKGYSYEEWKIMSKQLSIFTTQLKASIKRQREAEERINQLIFSI